MFLKIAAETVVSGGDGLRPEVVVPSVMVMPNGGELHAISDIDIALVREFVLVIHVAEYGIGNPRVNALEHVLLVDGGVDTVLARAP